MSDREEGVFVYFLIDNGLLQESSASYFEKDVKERPKWLEPIYSERALGVSPLLIDIEAAYEDGNLEQVMGYLNARKPALHVSIIETALKLEHIAQHMRRFIFILDPHGKQFSLRYADCAVLERISSVLTASQWTTICEPITWWGVHNRLGAICQLPLMKPSVQVQTPLILDWEQLAILDEASEPDHFVAKVKIIRHGEVLPGSVAEKYEWARLARQFWREAGNSNPLFLTFLTEAALVTSGQILWNQKIPFLLAMKDVSDFRTELREVILQIQEKSNELFPKF